MRLQNYSAFIVTLVTATILGGCAMTQTPVKVSQSTASGGEPAVSTAPVAAVNPGAPAVAPVAMPTQPKMSATTRQALPLDALNQIARGIRKNPAASKTYAGQTLQGKAKFVKTAKGNPNAMVADVRVNGLGEVSLWCRNVVGGAHQSLAGRVVSFEGVLTDSVYTSEDFSHDVILKDCRFHE